MSIKRVLQGLILIAVVCTALIAPGHASAWYCGSTVTVQYGDTLSGIAAACGTSIYAIQSANPGLGWWVYAGQVLYIPGGSSYSWYQPSNNYGNSYGGNTYVVKWGDTLASIAYCYGISVNDLLAANPSIWSASWIYAGQVLNIPYAAPQYYTVQYGDTLKMIAGWYGTSIYSLQVLNPQIYNSNWIYAGQVIRVR